MRQSEVESQHREAAAVDASLLRQVSSLYPTLVSAIREVVSNAFDGDAQEVNITLDLDEKFMTIGDDGIGLTPQELLESYLRLGPSKGTISNRQTESGRRKIGRKGIGFLACTNFCKTVVIRSKSNRQVSLTRKKKIGLNGTQLTGLFGIHMRDSVLSKSLERLRVKKAAWSRSILPEIQHLNEHTLIKVPEPGQYTVTATLNCGRFETICVIDSDFLDDIKGGQDLDNWVKYAKIWFEEADQNEGNGKKHGTIVKLECLRSFVIQDLTSKPRKGFDSSISAMDGVQRLVWHISRVIPVEYELPEALNEQFGEGSLVRDDIQFVPKVTFRIGSGMPAIIRRRVWFGNGQDHSDMQPELVWPVRIWRDDLRVTGYVLGNVGKIYPKEYRGLTIRVRNVAVGDPSFLGAEKKFPAKDSWVLDQITGEIQILRGIDALNGLTPGRGGFNTDNGGYKRLVREVVGEGESISGILGTVIGSLKTRRTMQRKVESIFKKANQFRRALVDISSAINNFGTENSWGSGIRSSFGKEAGPGVTLVSRRNWPDEIPRSIGGFTITKDNTINPSFLIDLSGKLVRINQKLDIWKRNLFILGVELNVIRKLGSEDDPLCEFDFTGGNVYVNWGHPLRTRMGDNNFVRSAVGWQIARQAYPDNSEKMMKLGLELLSYKSS